MNELATTEQSPLVILGGMDMKTIEPDKVEKLLNLQERWEDRQAKKAHATAVVAFQADMPQIHKGRSVQGKYQYASYDDIMRVARPILQRHGLAVSFSQSEEEKTITITCHITHRDGHGTETPLTIPKVEKIQSRQGQDVTNSAQAMGSTLSYAKRYCLCNALDIVVTDEDDDGQAADMHMVTEEQSDELLALMDQADELKAGTKAGFMRWAEVASICDLPEKRFDEARRMLNGKIKKLREGAA